MNKNLTIKDIAKLAGVHHSTVSRVINDSEMISAATKAKVLKVIKEHDYQINQHARSLSSNKSNTILIVIFDLCNPFFAEVTTGMINKLGGYGYDVIIKENKYNESFNEVVKLVNQGQCDGIIFVGSTITKQDYLYLKLKVPIVLCSENFVLKEQLAVYLDDDAVCEKLFMKIKTKDYQHVCYVHGDVNSSSRQRRMKAITKYGKLYGLKTSFVTGSSYSEKMKQSLTKYNNESFMIYNSDFYYLSAIRLGFAGFSFDNTMLIKKILTDKDIYIYRDLNHLGQVASELMLDSLQHPHTNKVVVLGKNS